MVRFRVPPLPRWQHLRRNATLPPLLVHLLGDILRNLLLLCIMEEDATPVLRADIRTLSVRRGGVVHLVEVLEEGTVGDFLGVEDYLEGLGVYRCVSTTSYIRNGFQSEDERTS